MIRIEQVELTNPGQFFACCGIFEVAHRLEANVVAHFDSGAFVVSTKHLTLEGALQSLQQASLEDLDPADATASPLQLAAPFELRLDWWKDKAGGGVTLKPWAGTMRGGRIARAMRASLSASLASGRLFDHGMVVFEHDGMTKKKVEPFYFDARRAANALSIDVGFSTDALSLETLAFPGTEFLTLVGLQRFRPASAPERPRTFVYSSWLRPLPIELAALAASGLPVDELHSFRFENAFRTDQRKHKCFSPAVPLTGEDHG